MGNNMSYTPIPESSSGDEITATTWNTWIRYNFQAKVPDIFEAKGDMVIGEGADTGARLAVGANGTYFIPSSTSTLGVRWKAPGTAVARAHANSTQSIPSAINTHLQVFGTETFDSVNGFASNRYDIQAGCAGRYLFAAAAQTESSTEWSEGEYIQLALYKNGATLVGMLDKHYAHADASVGYKFGLSGATIIDCDSGDYYSLYIYQNSGAAIGIPSSTSATYFSVAWIGTTST